MVKTLSNDRDIEWGFATEMLEPATEFISALLDFGPIPPGAPTSQLAIRRGYHVTAVGLEEITLRHPNFSYIRADINSIQQPGRFDVVVNVSTTEHVGLGRYGDPLDPDGDLKAMRRLREWMRPFGRHILTIPIGQDAVVGHYHRVYGADRLPKLLEGYHIIESMFWVKNERDQWIEVGEEWAITEPPTLLPVESPLHLYYAIGGFVLGR